MFEKEAEEYADKDFALYEPTYHERYAKETDWRNGAEFGYNKAKEEYEAKLKALTENRDDLLNEVERLEEHIAELNECF